MRTEERLRFERQSKMFDMAREIIRHEDGLINNRVTWFLVLQGFLINAFVTGVGLFGKGEFFPNKKIYLVIGLYCIGILGLVYCFFLRTITDQAYNQIHFTAEWWKARNPNANSFPPVRGQGKGNVPSKWLGTHTMPWFFALAWIVLLLSMTVATVNSWSTN